MLMVTSEGRGPATGHCSFSAEAAVRADRTVPTLIERVCHACACVRVLGGVYGRAASLRFGKTLWEKSRRILAHGRAHAYAHAHAHAGGLAPPRPNPLGEMPRHPRSLAHVLGGGGGA